MLLFELSEGAVVAAFILPDEVDEEPPYWVRGIQLGLLPSLELLDSLELIRCETILLSASTCRHAFMRYLGRRHL